MSRGQLVEYGVGVAGRWRLSAKEEIAVWYSLIGMMVQQIGLGREICHDEQWHRFLGRPVLRWELDVKVVLAVDKQGIWSRGSGEPRVLTCMV